ncbi:CRISPR-associated endonuclease Cas2 [Synechococcus sp. CS-1328]|uniref:CRISPR-associated endonuclease Cas2 n=1 Tax=Synechococcus sp. CS-1328 TaxID=2847976 RepID=UPI00223AEB1F|nr:CRISPR-associated endonuclease Cas2 [Synechococcus sp. CS-1328]
MAYDSPSNRRRRKIASLLEGYGVRVQWSVFECRLREEEIKVLVHRLRRIVNDEQDSIRLWPLRDSSLQQVVQLGKTPSSSTWSDTIL